MPNADVISSIFLSVLDLMLRNDWKGACHESSAAIHVLLNESQIENTWYIGEVSVGNLPFDHSWIEIQDGVFDLAICKPLIPAFYTGPTINGVNIETNTHPIVRYGIHLDIPDDAMTALVKKTNLTSYFNNSPIGPLGTWGLIDNIGKAKLNKRLNIPKLKRVYNKKVYTLK